MTAIAPVQFRLEGRRALVTGAASGIGLASAERLARSGARVALNDISTEKLAVQIERLTSEGLAVVGVPGDLGRSETAHAVARDAVERLGGMDYLVNNAGAPLTRTPIPAADLEALTDEFWDRILRINLLSAFWMTKSLAAALRAARARSSTRYPLRRSAAAGAAPPTPTAKAGLAGLTRELARVWLRPCA